MVWYHTVHTVRAERDTRRQRRAPSAATINATTPTAPIILKKSFAGVVCGFLCDLSFVSKMGVVRPQVLNDVFQAAADQARQKLPELTHNQKVRTPALYSVP